MGQRLLKRGLGGMRLALASVRGSPVHHSGGARRVLMIYDFASQPLSVGDLLIFQEASLIVRETQGLDVIDFALVYDPDNPVVSDQAFSHVTPDNFLFHLSSIFPAVQVNAHLGSLFVFDSHSFLESFIAANASRYHVWPPPILYAGREYLFYHCFNSVFFDFFNERGFLPELKPRPVARSWAREFIAEHAGSRRAGTVQLRNNPKTPDRNSNYDCWLDFFRYCARTHPVTFIVICSPSEIDPRLRSSPNVVIAKDHFTNLEQDLALIEAADFHMGPSSGPATIAQFNRKPYCMFSWDLNSRLLKGLARDGQRHRFVFSTPLQSWMSEKETTDTLIAEFERIWPAVDGGSRIDGSEAGHQPAH